MNWALLAGLIAAYLWYVRGGGAAAGGGGRIARYRRWLRRAPLAFGATSLLALLLAGRLGSLGALPPEFTTVAATARQLAGFGGDELKLYVASGFGGGVLLGLILSWWRGWRGMRSLITGRIARFLPRTSVEIAWAGLLGVFAAAVEELFYRLALPLVIALATGRADLAFLIATAMFALAHHSHGWRGVALAAVIGGALAILYLATADLWFAILVHALINLNGLVLRPALLGPARR